MPRRLLYSLMMPLLLISLALAATCLITLISSTFSATAAECSSQTGHTEVRVIHFINGNLGDNTFFDSAASGYMEGQALGFYATWLSVIDDIPRRMTRFQFINEIVSACGTWPLEDGMAKVG